MRRFTPLQAATRVVVAATVDVVTDLYDPVAE
jgi:hypothetical protein